ncbi:ERF family protein [Desulfovibrio litoralis]|uniref:ERF superfamily protein n=1 Tax=Desulfovibrio litoralis DSM 11393 TaxID=1121455 RepID=A0A1M7TPZ3_9BACT|nr:ERF family protein [Desulfovibrio litoralis]SHN72693.1 ERF superfamily protein [Desulfovibrio litoralis DSM 11393]
MNLLQFCSETITELAKAMLNVQASLQPALKDKDNLFTRSRYATLNSVMEACREALLVNGIWMTQYPVPLSSASMLNSDQAFEGSYAGVTGAATSNLVNNLGLVTKLVHAESGQWQSSLLVMPLPKTDPQGYGSAITYARRYALSALVGIVTEDDDDASFSTNNKAQNKNKKPKFEPENSEAQRQTTSAPNSDNQDILSQLPKLDGIAYSVVTTQDNRLCIVAKGDTRTKKQLLQQAGFSWSENRKMWWRYADVA